MSTESAAKRAQMELSLKANALLEANIIKYTAGTEHGSKEYWAAVVGARAATNAIYPGTTR